ncbi:MAG: ABC transporter ATP-binding protein [Clostridia bacterium]|nr:ABC transporter ATP-binding protein [Clostridia bacterium]
MRKRKDVASIGHILQNYKYSFKFMWKYSKIYLILSFFSSILGGLFPSLQLILTSRLFNILEKGCPFDEALTVIIIMTVCACTYVLLMRLYSGILVPRFSQSIHLKVQSILFGKVRRLELAKYDDPEFYNGFVLAMQNADSYATAAMTALNNLFSCVLSVVTTLGIVIYIDLVAMLIMFASAIMAMIIDANMKKIEFKKQLDITPIGRRKEYIDRVHKRADFAKELRLSDLGEILKQDYEDNTADFLSLIKRYGKKTAILGILDGFNINVIYLITIAWTIYRMVVIGSVSLGGFTIIVTSCTNFKGSLVRLVKLLTGISKQSMQIDKVRSFLEYEPEERRGSLPAPRFESIEYKNVSFGYNPDKAILHGINLKICKGDKIAIVGYNGAGKSTFIKLLMRLYEPTEGSIIYNGRDYREYEMDSYRSNIGAVFQDFKIFATTVGENVLGDECTEKDIKTVESALHYVAFDEKLASLPNGIDTILTREFDEDGTELSGGESQKIAIARVFARPYDLIVMDEPSSALDPIAEYSLNKHIAEYANDKTVIFISHRLSTTRHADRIYMFEDGRIIETGTHEELISLDGKYAEMFKIQAEKYIVQ